MICSTTTNLSRGNTEPWHAGFLEMMPRIQRQASIAFKDFGAEAREDLVEEVVLHALIAFKALYDKGKADLAYASVLAMYGIRRVKIGRRVGVKMNVRDVSSTYCQLSKGISLQRLDQFDRKNGEWLEVLIEDKHAGPAETAAARLDVREWFRRMSSKDRRIARALAMGCNTGEVARQFRLSPGRISQKRRQYLESWREFQGEGQTAR